MHALVADLAVATELELEDDVVDLLPKTAAALRAFEIEERLSGVHDDAPCFVEIHAGAGGTEACAWAEILLRMYLRFANRQGWDVEIVDRVDDGTAGLKTAILLVEGAYAYGWLKNESGVHRLIRVSPFDSNAKVHTSFAGVYVRAQIEENDEIIISDADLHWEPYRGSGPGGQHQNKTESAVRLKHLPTGTVVQSSTNRCQHQNRRTALLMLRSALYDQLQVEKRKADAVREGSKLKARFGSQIRTYSLHSRNVVKDERTGVKVFGTEKVLDGHLDALLT